MSKRLRKKGLPKLLGTVGVVGVGRVGSALARLLVEHSVPCLVLDNSFETAETVADRSGAELAKASTDLVGRVQSVFLATPDDQIRETASELAERGLQVAFAAHMSGALPSTLLRPLAKGGAALASIHPVQTFKGDPLDWKLLEGCTFAIEGDTKGAEVALAFVECLSGRALMLKADQKPLYHATCSAASNFVVTLWHLVERLGLQAGLTPVEVRKTLLPLVEQTLRNLAQSGPLFALTGPIARGDTETVRRQVDAVNSRIGVGVRSLFAELALATADLAHDAGLLREEQLVAVKEVLRGIERDGFVTGADGMYEAQLDADVGNG